MGEQDEASDASSAGTASPAASLLAADTAGEARTAGNLRAVAAACIAGIGPFIFGYTLGFTSPAQLPMEVGASGPFGAVLESHLDADGAVASSQAALFGSIVNVGAMLGALVAGPLADSIGRRLTIAAAALPWILAWSAIAFGRTFAEVLADRRTEGKGETLERHTERKTLHSAIWPPARFGSTRCRRLFTARGCEQVLAGRLLSGVAVGVASMAVHSTPRRRLPPPPAPHTAANVNQVPLYISETAPTSIRGALGAVNQLAVTLGAPPRHVSALSWTLPGHFLSSSQPLHTRRATSRKGPRTV